MALESLDEIDKMSRKELWKRANDTLQEYRKMRGTDPHTLLIDAEFYLRQVRDKDERRRRLFELILEVGLAGCGKTQSTLLGN
jgi:hypothetical protein